MNQAIRSRRFEILWRVGVLLLALAVWIAIAASILPKTQVKAAKTIATVAYSSADEDTRLIRAAVLAQPAGPAVPAAKGGTVAPTALAPGELQIPSLGIDGRVYPVGVDRAGNMDVTQNAFTVGWYNRGPAPGQPGNAVFACHNTWYTAPRALCFNLHQVSTGATVMTKDAKGALHQWAVDSVQTYAFNANVAGLFATSGPAKIAIVTCAGTWIPSQQIYTLRLIVYAHLVA